MKNEKLKVSALLTARGNNTLKDKNIRLVLGNPLLYYPAIAAKESDLISSFYVSSDDDKILNIAGEYGYQKIKRPEALAQPTSHHVDAIKHSLNVMDSVYSDVPDLLVVLLGNSATIKTEWINDCINLIKNDDTLSAVVPVIKEMDYHPYRAKKINEKGLLEPFFDFGNDNISTNRQDLVPNYFLCHNFWVLNLKKSIYCEKGQQPWTFMGNTIKPYIVEESFDVHDEDDIIKTEKWLKLNVVRG